MPTGLAPKLILSLTAIVLLVVGVFAVVNAHIQEQELLDEVVRGTDRVSKAFTRSTWHLMLADHRESAYDVMRTIARQDDEVRRVRIFNKQGMITFSTGEDTGHKVDLTAEACTMCHARGEPLIKVNAPSRVRYFGPEGDPLLGMVTPIYNEPACHACHPEEQKVLGVLDVSFSLKRVRDEVAGINTRSLLAGGISVLLIAVFVALFTRRFVVRPVRELIAATQKVAAMDLEPPLDVRSEDEIGELGNAFNQMRVELITARRKIDGFTRDLERMVEERTEQLEAAQSKLIQENRLAALGRLSASVAHEINNPLSGVLNFGKLMERLLTEDGVPPDRIEDFRRYLSQIVSETARAGRIVSDLLSFSRRSRSETVPRDLNEIVRKTMSVVGHKLDAAGVAAELDLADDLPRVPCDGSHVQQVITNLVLNAAEAMSTGGVVRVGTRRHDTGESAVLTVADEGEGIERDDLPRIFDPFFTTKEEGKGVGLGLAVVYGIVESHGGAIEVESRPGLGTTFTVTLPEAAPGAAEEEE